MLAWDLGGAGGPWLRTTGQGFLSDGGSDARRLRGSHTQAWCSIEAEVFYCICQLKINGI